MKRVIVLVALFGLFCSGAVAQNNPVKWDGEVKKLEEGKMELVLTASVDEGWYIYSQFLEDGGPVPTKITFNGENAWSVADPTESGEHKKSGYDTVFEMEVTKFADEAVFSQQFKMAGSTKEITGTVMYMSCNDEMCLPPKRQKFKISSKGVTFE